MDARHCPLSPSPRALITSANVHSLGLKACVGVQLVAVAQTGVLEHAGHRCCLAHIPRSQGTIEIARVAKRLQEIGYAAGMGSPTRGNSTPSSGAQSSCGCATCCSRSNRRFGTCWTSLLLGPHSTPSTSAATRRAPARFGGRDGHAVLLEFLSFKPQTQKSTTSGSIYEPSNTSPRTHTSSRYRFCRGGLGFDSARKHQRCW